MDSTTLLVMFALLCCCVTSNAYENPDEGMIRDFFANLKLTGYNTEIMPVGNGGPGSPVEVSCSLYVIDVHKIDDHSLDYRVSLYIRQNWNDSRLTHSGHGKTITLNNRASIWTPDLFVVQEKEGIWHTIISPNSFIRITSKGEVKYSVRLSLTLTCPMEFSKFPHDVQECSFRFESYGRTREALQLSWESTPGAVSKVDTINVLPFELKKIDKDVKNMPFTFGNYTALEVSLTFQRKAGFFMTRMYIPFMFLVGLSWLSFWIPAKMIALRLSLLLVVLYLMVNIGSGINDLIPPAPYTKGSDVWLAVCETLVFLAFLEFIAVHIISRNKEKLEKKLRKNDPEAQRVLDSDSKINPISTEPTNSTITISFVAMRLKRDVLVSSRIEKVSRILFPILFLVFNFIYWLVYCTNN